MYCIRKTGIKQCSVEFGFMTPKRKKRQVLKKLFLSIQNDVSFIGGEICGIDFNVEKVLHSLKTKKFLLENESNQYATLFFLTQDDSDFETVLDQFDAFSEGYYTLYLLPTEVLGLNDEEIDLKKIGFKNFLIRVSVYSDATYVEFDFMNETICQKFIENN